MEKEARTKHSQVSLSLLVTNLTALKNFYSSVFYFHYVRLLQWAAPTILLAFLLHTSGRLLFWHVVTMWRKMAPSTAIKKKVLPVHVDMSRKKKTSHIIDPFSHSPMTDVQWTFQIHILTHSSQSANIRKRLGGCHSLDFFTRN